MRVVSGKVFDVAVELRKYSPTYGKWEGVVLSAENKRQFFISRGFAPWLSCFVRYCRVLLQMR